MSEAKISPAQIAASEKYKREHYDRLQLLLPAGSRERLRAAATAAGFSSVNGWIAALLERETGERFRLTGELPYKKKEKSEQQQKK